MATTKRKLRVLEAGLWASLACRAFVVTALLAGSVLLAGCGGQRDSGDATFFVAPSGDDAAAGTFAAPFRTPQRAQTAERAALRAGAGNVDVVLRGGTYRLSAPLRFDARDSPSAGTVTWRAYRGERPVLSGGAPITGFTAAPYGRWVAPIPEGWHFRQLYVNGVRGERAGGPITAGWLRLTPTGYAVEPSTLLTWRNPHRFEFVYERQWTELRGRVASMRGDEIVMQEPFFSIARRAFNIDQPTYISNAFELMDTPGEWYLDNEEHLLYYLPRPGETLETASVVVPRLTELVVGAGTSDRPAHDLAFVGLTFADVRWRGVRKWGGWAAIQAGFAAPSANDPTLTDDTWRKMDSAVSFTWAERVRFVDTTFTRLGGAGLALAAGSRDNVVTGSTFTDISGSGIQLGDVTGHHPVDSREIVSGNRIVGNTITNVGAEYAGSVGIWAGYVRETLIGWNELSDLPYTAISLGWGWDRRDQPGNPSGQNVVANNLVHDYLLRLQDGGGVYLLGSQPRTVVEGNVIYDQREARAGDAIYIDDGSRGVTVRGNAVWNANGAAFMFKGTEYTITGNYWESSDGGYGWSQFGGGIVRDNTTITGRHGVPAAVITQAGPQSLPAAVLEWEPVAAE